MHAMKSSRAATENGVVPAGDTVQNIVDVAQELVQSRGFNAFSYRDVAARVGVKTSSIHYHFPTKGDLACALVSRYRAKMQSARDHIEATYPRPVEQVEAFLNLLCATFERENMICLCGMLATDAATLPDDARAEIRGFFEDNETWLLRVLEQGRKAGELHFEGEPEEASHALFCAMQGAMIGAATFGRSARVNECARWILGSLKTI